MILGKDEKIVRIFDLSAGMVSDIQLEEEVCVTNKRVVHTVKRKTSNCTEENSVQINLKAITGVSCGKGYSRNTTSLKISILLMVSVVVMIIVAAILNNLLTKILLGVAGFLLFVSITILVVGLRKKYSAYINISAVVGEKAIVFSAGSNSNSKIFINRVEPSQSFLEMIEELPSLLYDFEDAYNEDNN